MGVEKASIYFQLPISFILETHGNMADVQTQTNMATRNLTRMDVTTNSAKFNDV